MNSYFCHYQVWTILQCKKLWSCSKSNAIIIDRSKRPPSPAPDKTIHDLMHFFENIVRGILDSPPVMCSLQGLITYPC